MSNLSRRSLVSSAAALPALAVPAVALASTEPDPIFAAIDAHRVVWAAMIQVSEKLDDAEGAVVERRPSTLIEWRGYCFCAETIERGLEWHLEQPNADRKVIEREYPGIKAKAREAVQAEQEWYERNDLVELQTGKDRLIDAERTAVDKLAEIYPTTIAGAAALIEYAISDINLGDHEWQLAAIGNAAKVLSGMCIHRESAAA